MDEKLIKYFAGEMSSSDMREFEKVISESPSLKKEAAEYREFFSDIERTSRPDVDERYFANLIPRFRVRREYGKEKKYHPAFSFATAVLTVIVVLLFIPHSNNLIKEESPVVNYSTSEISDYLTTNSDQPVVTNLPADIEANYDSLLDRMIYEELSNNNRNIAGAELVDNLDYNTLLQSLNSNDASAIYEQLKNKKIF